MPRSGNTDDDENQITHALGRYRGLSVHLSVRANPSLDARAPEEFAVNLFLALPGGASVDVARIDTSHDGAHYDRLYLPVDDPLRRDYGVDVVDYREAQRVLLENWRAHVEAYAETHGLPGADVDPRG